LEVKSMFSRLLLPGTIASLTAALLVAMATAAGTATSGPQVGAKMPGPFQPLNVTGPDAGKKSCLYCRFGMRPVVMVFAREVSPEVGTLMKRIETATAALAEKRLGSCVVFCNEAESLPGQLVQVAKQEHLDHIILATCAASGPPRYGISPDADVTVLLYDHATVRANHAFKKGE